MAAIEQKIVMMNHPAADGELGNDQMPDDIRRESEFAIETLRLGFAGIFKSLQNQRPDATPQHLCTVLAAGGCNIGNLLCEVALGMEVDYGPERNAAVIREIIAIGQRETDYIFSEALKKPIPE